MNVRRHPHLFAGAFAALLLSCLSAQAADKSVSILEPKSGATVSSPFKVRFAVSGMTVHPATEVIEGTGHHHLLINHGPIKEGEVIPMDETHLHYGKGQTEAEVTLPPGQYKLTAQFGNGAHQSYGKKMSDTVDITVR